MSTELTINEFDFWIGLDFSGTSLTNEIQSTHE